MALYRQLETTDDFDDEAMDLEGTARNNGRSSTLTSKVSKFIGAQDKTRKVCLTVCSFISSLFFFFFLLSLYKMKRFIIF